MKLPHVLLYGCDDRRSAQFRKLTDNRRWLLRQAHTVEVCYQALRRGNPAVLLIFLKNDLAKEFSLLARVHWLYPHAATLLVTVTGDPVLTRLAWEVGADAVLSFSEPASHIVDVVNSLMALALTRAGFNNQEAAIRTASETPVHVEKPTDETSP